MISSSVSIASMWTRNLDDIYRPEPHIPEEGKRTPDRDRDYDDRKNAYTFDSIDRDFDFSRF